MNMKEFTSDFLTHDFVAEKLKSAEIKSLFDWNTSLGETIKEKYESFYIKIVEVTNSLVRKGAKGYFWIVAPPEIASFFEMATAAFQSLAEPQYFQEQIPLGVPGVYELGMLNRRWRLFTDPDMEQTVMLIGVEDGICAVLKLANFVI